jgi:excisionase family DNA binding protein
MPLPDARERPTLSVDEVAEILGWGRSSVYEAVRREQIPALRLGRRIRIPTARLHELLGTAPEPTESVAPQPVFQPDLTALLVEVIARGIELAHQRGAI